MKKIAIVLALCSVQNMFPKRSVIIPEEAERRVIRAAAREEARLETARRARREAARREAARIEAARMEAVRLEVARLARIEAVRLEAAEQAILAARFAKVEAERKANYERDKAEGAQPANVVPVGRPQTRRVLDFSSNSSNNS